MTTVLFAALSKIDLDIEPAPAEPPTRVWPADALELDDTAAGAAR